VTKIQRVLAFIVLLSFQGCKENPKTYYATVADATADKAFERGWLPEIMRTDVAEIHESHDLDSNHGWATFRYHGQFPMRVESDCARIPIDKIGTWPKFMNDIEASARMGSKTIDAYKCGPFVAVLDSGKQFGYVWQ
jgi:hypothetical protein